MQVQIEGMDEALRGLGSITGAVETAVRGALTRCALVAHRDSVRNAPRSPSQQIRNRLRKTTRKVRRKDRATSRAKPGGLERSIEYTVGKSDAEVFVAANSEAGKYAAKIHDGGPRGSGQWRKPGPGTVAKGSRAGDKFIERAIDDNRQNFLKMIKHATDEQWRRLNQ